MTLTLGGDGNVHLYETGTTFDIVPPQTYGAIGKHQHYGPGQLMKCSPSISAAAIRSPPAV